ncbi:MAG: serine protease, partial [Chitinophagaceae bacterium]
MIEDINLVESVERYLQGDMTEDELAKFEQLRKSSPELDQLVVEYSIFLHHVSEYGDHKNFKTSLHDIHANLLAAGEIEEKAPRAKVIDLLKKYRRVIAVAASIAGLTALSISGLIAYFTPTANTAYVEQLSRKVNKLEQNQNALSNQIINTTKATKIPIDANVKSGGTGFLVDAKGYVVTNAHVIGDNKNVVLQNNKSQEFKATIIKIDHVNDLAILKIEDEDYKPSLSLPYGFKKMGADLGEEIFTLGYPRDEIVYGQGYMSAKTGFNGDTLACQIAVAANPGNSGGPVLNKNGEVVGILSTRQVQAEGVVFAIKTKNIYNSLETMREDSLHKNIRII